MINVLQNPVPTMEVENKILDSMSKTDFSPISSGVAATGEAAAYALVWEYGNIRQTKQGPRTVLGVSAATGAPAWLSTQAPTGYVRIHEPQYWQIIKDELGKMDIASAEDFRSALQQTAERISQRIVKIIQEAAPVGMGPGAGVLRDSIHEVACNDPLLQEGSQDRAFQINPQE